MKKIILTGIAVIMMMALSSSAFAKTNDKINLEYFMPKKAVQKSKINSLYQLKKEIDKSENQGKITKSKKEQIVKETHPEVLQDYIEDMDEKVSFCVNNKKPDSVYYDEYFDKTVEKYSIEIDPLSHAEITLVDQEEETLVNALACLKKQVIPTAYAAKNGETKWKEYNKDGSKRARFFTAKYKRCIGPGYGTFITENHYYVSSKGIQESHGKSWVDSFKGLTVSVSDKGHTIEDGWAKKKGEDAHIKTYWTLKQVVGVEGNNYYNYETIYERTKIKYLEKNSAKHKIKVEHSWKKI